MNDDVDDGEKELKFFSRSIRAADRLDMSCHDVIEEEEVQEKSYDKHKIPNVTDTLESDGQIMVDFAIMRKRDAVIEHVDECDYEDHDLEELKNAFVTCKSTRYNKLMSQEHDRIGLSPEFDGSDDESSGKI